MYVPLAHDPDVLFGLRVKDLVWPAAAALADLSVWRTWHTTEGLKVAVMSAMTSVGLLLAVTQIDETTLPEWIARWVLYWTRPRLYLP